MTNPYRVRLELTIEEAAFVHRCIQAAVDRATAHLNALHLKPEERDEAEHTLALGAKLLDDAT